MFSSEKEIIELPIGKGFSSSSSSWPSLKADEESTAAKAAELSDDSSTCAPSSVSASMRSTPCFGPADIADLDLHGGLPWEIHGRALRKVVIVHHDEMQLHVPPRPNDVYELPKRVIAIENALKGIKFSNGIPKMDCLFGEDMKFITSRKRGFDKVMATAYGSVSPKRRRVSHGGSRPMPGSVWQQCHVVRAPVVSNSDLLLVHSRKHINKVHERCGLAESKNAAFYPLIGVYGHTKTKVRDEEINDDMFYSPDSLIAIKRAVGGAVEAVRQLFVICHRTGRATGRSEQEHSFAIVRPPGHHCCNEPHGFCFFNNTAVAAAHARKVLKLKRVAIVDWDYHHGDGSQRLFYKDPSILTISTHVALSEIEDGTREVAFPCNRDMGIAFNGCGDGLGMNINISWMGTSCGAQEYEEAFRTIILPALQGFDPELILVASGFDATCGDDLAGTQLPSSSFYEMTQQLLGLGKPLAVILEGGYSPRLLAQGVLNVVQALLGLPPPEPLKEPDLPHCCTQAASSAEARPELGASTPPRQPAAAASLEELATLFTPMAAVAATAATGEGVGTPAPPTDAAGAAQEPLMWTPLPKASAPMEAFAAETPVEADGETGPSRPAAPVKSEADVGAVDDIPSGLVAIPGDLYDHRAMMEAVRRRLNTLACWKKLAKRQGRKLYFQEESTEKAARAASAAAATLRRFFKKPVLVDIV